MNKNFLLTNDDLQKIKQLELNMLLEMQRVCAELNINFYLDAGTLLGAIRHQGFIPWDDDIDICMMREDYETFMSEAPKYLSDRFFLQTPENSPQMPASFMKLRLNGTSMVESLINDVPGNHGIWIDIFPFDVVKNNTNFKLLKYRQIFWCKLFDLKMRKKASSHMTGIRAICRNISHSILRIVPRKFILSRMKSKTLNPSEKENGYITCFHYGKSFFKLPYKSSFPAITVSFEGHKMYALATWKEYLAQLYGEWQKLPPQKEQVPHHFVSKLDFGEYAKTKTSSD